MPKRSKIHTHCLHCAKEFAQDEARYDSWGVRDSICSDCFSSLRSDKPQKDSKKWFTLQPIKR